MCSTVPYKCHQVLHPWHPHCTSAAWMLARSTYIESFKIYCVLYGVSGLFKLKKIKNIKQLQRFLSGLAVDTVRSTLFLGMHGLLAMPIWCSSRQMLGHISYYKLYIQNIGITLPAILIERKQRRGALALYVTNLAVEILFKMAVQRKMFTPLHNGEVLLFAIASAIYTFMLKITSEHKHNSFLFSIVKNLIGKEECAPSLIEQPPPTKPKITKSAILNFLSMYMARVKQWSILQNKNKPICTHQYHCFVHILLGFAQRFLVGVLIQFILHFISSPFRFLKRPSLFFRTLNKNAYNLAKFFGFYAGIYRFISCLLRNILRTDRPAHGLFAGYLAGFAMLFYKNTTLAMYMMSKLIESVYFKLAHDGRVPLLPWFDSVLYALSTALIFHAAIVEPQAMRPAYFKFLERLTGGLFSQVNRPMIDCYGVSSSKLFPNYQLPSVE